MKKAVLAVVLVAMVIVLTGCSGKQKLDKQEAVAYTSLRLAIAQSAYNSSGKLESKHLDTLKETVKKFDKNSDWFDDYLGSFYGINKDTNENQIDYICNKNYCAKFTVKAEGTDYYLIDYSFIENDIEGYYINVN